MTPGESFCPGMVTILGESLYAGIQRLQESRSVLGYNDSMGVIES